MENSNVEELLEQIYDKDKRGEGIFLSDLFPKLMKFLDSDLDKLLKDKAISISFGLIVTKLNKNKAFKLLDSISNITLKEEAITRAFFQIVERVTQDEALELLDSISNAILKEEAIARAYGGIVTKFDNNQALEILDSISNTILKEEAIARAYEAIVNKFDNNQALKLLNSISNTTLKEEAITRAYIGIITRFEKNEALKLCNLIFYITLKEKTIIRAKNMIRSRFGNNAIREFKINTISNSKDIFSSLEEKILLTSNKFIKIKTINQYMNFALDNNLLPNIDIVKEILNQELKQRVIETFFDSFMRVNEEKAVRLLYGVKDDKLEKKFILPRIDKLHQKLNNIQKTIHNKNQNSAISKAYKKIQKENSNSVELEKLTIKRLSFLIIHEEETNNFERLLDEFKKRLREQKKNYSELIFEIIKSSKIQDSSFDSLELLIEDRKTKIKLKKLKEQRATQKDIDSIIDTIINSKVKNKEQYFVQLFRKQHNINTIHVVIPQIAIQDFKLAKRLLNRVKNKKLKEQTQKTIFLTLQEDLSQIMFSYERIDDFYIKEKLSKQAIAHHLPTYTNSFFYKSLSALDSRNIMNTLDDLATVAPREVLKYYEKIIDEVGDKLKETIKKIEQLKQKRAEAKVSKDIKNIREIKRESKEIKDEIYGDRELFEAFLGEFDIDEFDFEDGDLLDFEL